MPANAPDSNAKNNPLLTALFSIEISGKIAGYFTEVSGLGSETDVVEHKVSTASGQQVVQKIPGRLKWENITLKRGITAEMDVWKWRDAVIQGQVEQARSSGTITMFDQEGKACARWDFVNAWPCKVSGPSIQAGNSDVGIEEMVLTHEGITRAQ